MLGVGNGDEVITTAFSWISTSETITQVGATPVTGSVALPHLRLQGISEPMMLLARSKDGVNIDVGDVFGAHHEEQSIHAIFFLVSPEDDPSQHLRLLAQLAGHVDKDEFMTRWLTSTTNQEMKEILLREDRFVSLNIKKGGPRHTFTSTR